MWLRSQRVLEFTEKDVLVKERNVVCPTFNLGLKADY